VRYVCNALSPAKVDRVYMDEDTRRMEVIVPDDQLSLAIGRAGQNVRLAAKLTGWRIDVKNEAGVAEEEKEGYGSLMKITGIGERTANLLYEEGYKRYCDGGFGGTRGTEFHKGNQPEQGHDMD